MGTMRTRRGERLRRQLSRDQNGKCFYCQMPLRDDCTIEHLRAKANGGGHNYGNLRAAHSMCNTLVGHMSVEDKQSLAYIGRTEGTDAFFRALAAMKPRRPRKPSQRKLRGKMRLVWNQAGTHEEVRAAYSYAADSLKV